jgi:hypothetical protein
MAPGDFPRGLSVLQMRKTMESNPEGLLLPVVKIEPKLSLICWYPCPPDASAVLCLVLNAADNGTPMITRTRCIYLIQSVGLVG